MTKKPETPSNTPSPDDLAMLRELIKDATGESLDPFMAALEQRLSYLDQRIDVVIRALQMMAEGDEELSTSEVSDHVDMSGRPIL